MHELAHREQRAPAIVVDQDALERFVHVVRLAGQMLEVPLDSAGGRVELGPTEDGGFFVQLFLPADGGEQSPSSGRSELLPG